MPQRQDAHAAAPGRDGGSRARPGYRPDIDGLRAIAVLAVMAFHAFPRILPGGYVGVDVFFVISGFLITGILLNELARTQRLSIVNFYARRVRRIFPALAVVLLSCLAYGWLYYTPAELAFLGKHVAGGAGFASNFLLWKESGYFDVTATGKPLLHLWSLGIEEQFYLAWPLLMLLAWRRRFGLLSLALCIVGASFALNVATVRADVVAAFYAPWTRFWELLMGAALACMHADAPTRVRSVLLRLEECCARLAGKAMRAGSSEGGAVLRNMASGLGLACLTLATLALDKDSRFPGAWALLPTLGGALLIAAGPAAWLNRRVLASGLMVRIGLVSYPLYLWHWPLLSLAWSEYRSELGRGEFIMLRLGVLLASLVLATLTYLLVERPIRFGPNGNRKALAALALVASLGIFGGLANALRGFPQRIPAEIRALAEYSYEFERFPGEAESKEFSGGRESVTRTAWGHAPEDRPEAWRPGPGAQDGHVVLLRGDSHAEHLQPGFAARPDVARVLAQYLWEDAARLGRKTQLEVPLAEGDYARVDVFLSSLWVSPTPEADIFAPLARSIAQLRERGARSITIVGNNPTFSMPPQKMLIRRALRDPRHRVPRRLQPDFSFFALDEKMAAFAKEQNVGYISVMKLMCDAEGCLVRGEAIDDLYIFDTNHLTRSGSEHVVSLFPAPR
jgi:peptidoglycan/LPS O-acetylase OafA/YrhL